MHAAICLFKTFPDAQKALLCYNPAGLANKKTNNACARVLAGAHLLVNVRFVVSHEQPAEKNLKSKQGRCWAPPFLQPSCAQRQHAESTTVTATKPRHLFDVISFMSEAEEQYVRTVDGQDVPSEQAHRLCQKSMELSAFPASVKCIACVISCGGSLLCRLRWPSMAVVRKCLAVLARF